MRSTAFPVVSCVVVALASVGCGGSQPPAEAPAPADSPEDVASEPDTAGDPASDEGASGDERGGGSAENEDEGASKPSSRSGAIQDIIKKNRQQVRDCYEAGLKDKPDMKGDMVIHFKLDPEGKIAVAELVPDRSQIIEPKVVECAVAALKAMTFPPHPEGMETEVNYPFNLNP